MLISFLRDVKTLKFPIPHSLALTWIQCIWHNGERVKQHVRSNRTLLLLPGMRANSIDNMVEHPQGYVWPVVVRKSIETGMKPPTVTADISSSQAL